MTQRHISCWTGLLLVMSLVLSASSQDDASYSYDTYDDASTESFRENYNQLLVCDRSAIRVLSLAVLCDSRGSYYYGGPNYRNSETCQEGDKARMEMSFEILEDLSDSTVLFTATESGGPNTHQLFTHFALCNVDRLRYSWRTTCKQTGNYTLSFKFNYTADGANGGTIFYPYTSVGFSSGYYDNLFDLGGANTTYCPNNIVVTWTKKKKGLFSFLWSMFIFAGVIGTFSAFVFLICRREPCFPTGKLLWEEMEEEEDDDVWEDSHKKWHLVGGRKDILEFA